MQTGKEQEDDEKRVYLASFIYFILCLPSTAQGHLRTKHTFTVTLFS